MLQCRNLDTSENFKIIFRLATIKPAWFACAVLALIAILDETNALLFHVEHSDNRAWEFHIRQGGGEWSAALPCAEESAVVPLSHATAPVEAEWRWKDEEEWNAAVPHAFGAAAQCEFYVRAEDRHEPMLGDFRVCAAVRGQPSAWVLQMPQHTLAADGPENLTVTGISVCQGIGQVLRAEGEFQCKGGGFTVMNAGPSQAALLPVDSAVPGCLPFRGVFMVRTGRLTDEEIELLKRDAPPWPTTD